MRYRQRSPVAGRADPRFPSVRQEGKKATKGRGPCAINRVTTKSGEEEAALEGFGKTQVRTTNLRHPARSP